MILKVEEYEVHTISDYIEFYQNNDTERVMHTAKSADKQTDNVYEHVSDIPNSQSLENNIGDKISEDSERDIYETRNIDDVIQNFKKTGHMGLI